MMNDESQGSQAEPDGIEDENPFKLSVPLDPTLGSESQNNGKDGFFPEQERRKTNRRQNDRQGKYDRRRNRCAHCRHFQPPAEEGEVLGECLAHHSPMTAAAYACPVFESIPPPFSNS
jgi:hypothetical protein